MNTLDAIRIFSRVAERASFTQAAASLDLPKASATLAVQQLEQQLGTRLLQRSTRRVQLTQEGQAYYARCKEWLGELDELQTLFQLEERALSGVLRVDLAVGLVRHLVMPRLPEFLDAHPLLNLELSSTDRRVDLIAEGFDCVLRVGTVGDVNLIARTLGRMAMCNCASPDYLQRYGIPQSLDDLSQHRLIHYTSHWGSAPFGWEYPQGDGYATRPMAGVITVNSSEAYESACLAGLGLVQVPIHGVTARLARGELVSVLPQLTAEPMPVTLLYADRRYLPRRTQVYMHWLTELLRPHLLPPLTPMGDLA